ncbi:hypothetical protein Cob_v008398 [Colletotrichum orbiculare MAFF 240422]|uniref:Uncharacterized protein n=1 Tax=Colletotrichum orbiculare (strain 104-T / ATCC 96160 / CBS 514.97 / LARS 414 / MAFF 240422) TaxID=1213857 RepID=A0A484FJU7_COLOR|nr:hypothetical protein Cob_v008398 [Colletotrichum orbiculare MAFF 240422]
MQSSPDHPNAALRLSRLSTSIAELHGAIRTAEAEADQIETKIAYKDAEIDDLISDKISHNGCTKGFETVIRRAKGHREKLSEALESKRDEIANLKNKKERRQARLSAIPPVESTNAPDPRDNEQAAALLEITHTPWSRVFVTSRDGQTFISPAMLHGVPTEPITENGEYWEQTWTKFDDAINTERLRQQYEQDVDEWRQRRQVGLPTAQEEAEFAKKQYRNRRFTTEAKAAKRWFCPGTTLHPNQMMAKQYLPERGLCQSYIIYQICNLLSRLHALHERGELTIQPIYFLLWRMSVTFDRMPSTGPRSIYKSIVDQDHPSFDPVLRQAILRGAQHMNSFNSYGPRLVDSAARSQTLTPSSTQAADRDKVSQTQVRRQPWEVIADSDISTSAADNGKKASLETMSDESQLTKKRRVLNISPSPAERKKKRASNVFTRQRRMDDTDPPSTNNVVQPSSRAVEQMLFRPEVPVQSTQQHGGSAGVVTARPSSDQQVSATVHSPNEFAPSLRAREIADREASHQKCRELIRKYGGKKAEEAIKDVALEDGTAYFIPVGESDNEEDKVADSKATAKREIERPPFPWKYGKVSHGFIFND